MTCSETDWSCEINDSQIQRRLLSEKNLTFENALSLALGQETAAKNVRALQGAPVETHPNGPLSGLSGAQD